MAKILQMSKFACSECGKIVSQERLKMGIKICIKCVKEMEHQEKNKLPGFLDFNNYSGDKK